MTQRDINDWIIAHIKGGDKPEHKQTKDAIIKWSNMLACKFYEEGKKEGIKIGKICLEAKKMTILVYH